MKFNILKNKKQNLVYSLKSNNETLIGLYIGIWCGDGTQYYDKGYRIKICCHDQNKELIEFYRFILNELFGKSITHVNKGVGHQAYLRFNSKFIYHFVFDYIKYNKNKTHSVCLKNDLSNYSKKFLEGFLLGLILTDGYLKDKFYFNVTSSSLAKNAYDILKLNSFEPKHYIHKRAKYGWKDLHMISLSKKESQILLNLINSIIFQINYEKDFSCLKYKFD